MASEVTIKQEEQPASAEKTRPGRSFVPNVDIRETEEALRVWADVPGVDEDSLEVRLEDGTLTIQGRVALEDYAKLEPLYTEYNVGNFERSFRINGAIDSDQITARLADGVLQLELPKAERARRRQIPINTH